MRALVVYATKNGSTQRVAEVVAEISRMVAAAVDLRPARKTRAPLSAYDLVVLGAPLYSGRWHRDAHRFLRRHRGDLTGVPVAVFGMGPRQDTEESWRRSRSQLNRALVKHGWLKPVAVTVFGGADPPGHARSRHRDLRDWDAIRLWATQCVITAGRERTNAAEPVSKEPDTHGHGRRHRPPRLAATR